MAHDWDENTITAVGSSPFFVGAVGSIVTLKFAPGARFIDRLQNVIGGSACAGYGTPFLSDWMGWSSINVKLFSAFVIGVVSMTLVAEILQAMKSVPWAEMITTVIKAWLPSWMRKQPPLPQEPGKE